MKGEKDRILVAPFKKMGKRKKNKKDSKSELEQSETNSIQVSFLITENNSNCKKNTSIVNTPTSNESSNYQDQSDRVFDSCENKVIYLLTLEEEFQSLHNSDFLEMNGLRNISLN